MSEGGQQQQLLSIHYLRAIAALMVVAMHGFSYGLVPVDDAARITWLKHGVALFFVISGFVMVASTSGRAITPGDFMLRRIIRIVPLYWVVTLGWSLVADGWDAAHLAGSLVFLPTPDPATGALRSPLLEPGWTLNFEMFFYALFAMALWLRQGLRLWAISVVLIALVLLGRMGALSGLPAYYSDPLLLLFAGGMAIAHFKLRLPALAVPAGFGVIVLFSNSAASPYLTVHLPALAIVMGARSLDPVLRRWRLPVLLGDASYAIYLGHLFVIQLADRFVAPFLPGPLTLVVILLSSCIFGIQLHRAVEMPAGARLRAWAAQRQLARAAIAPA